MGETYNFVTEAIGDTYKDWKENDIVFISAPTGTGKTTFIFETLVKHALRVNMRVVYFVNRKALYNQLIKRLHQVEIDLWKENYNISLENTVQIYTYQMLEYNLKLASVDTSKYGDLGILLDNSYVVMDEAHYFFADSNFNTDTTLSLSYLMGYDIFFRTKSIRILISATGDNVYNYVRSIEVNRFQEWKRTHVGIPNSEYEGGKIIQYCIPLEDRFKNLNIQLIGGYDSLPDIICDDKDSKWLIFVDRKKHGQKLEKCLLKKGCDAVFIDSSYQTDSNAEKEMKIIAEEQRSTARVCIATYVLDNGISLEEDRTNIAIFADNKEEFLQCLGRCRIRDYSVAHLYIPKGDVTSFLQRRNEIEKTKQFVVNIFDRIAGQGIYITPDKQYLLIEKLSESERRIKYFKRVCYTCSRCTYKSLLSMMQLDYLERIYEILLDDLKSDPWAFAKLQLEWLNRGADFEELKDHCIVSLLETQKGLILEKLEKATSDVSEYVSSDDTDYILIQECAQVEKINQKVMSPYMINNWYNDIRKGLLNVFDTTIFENGEESWKFKRTLESARSDLNSDAPKPDGTKGQLISKQAFNDVMCYLDFPYRMGMKNAHKLQESDKKSNKKIPTMRWIEKVSESEIEIESDTEADDD